MQTFKNFLETWDMKSFNNHGEGKSVTVHKPGDDNHGKTGRIMRQQTTEYGVEFPHNMGKLHWYNASHLHDA